MERVASCAENNSVCYGMWYVELKGGRMTFREDGHCPYGVFMFNYTLLIGRDHDCSQSFARGGWVWVNQLDIFN